jgi:hypothetical protein
VAEVVNVAVGAEAADDRSAGRGVNRVTLGPDGDFAIVAHADAGLLAPDIGPPRAFRGGTDHGALFGEGLLVGGVGCLAEFAVEFILVGVRHELVEQVVGPGQFDDLFGCQEGDEPLLPVIVAAFDFAFGLRRGCVEQMDAVEVERLAELGEGVRVVGVEKGVVIYIENQWQAVDLKGAGEEVEVGQQGFRRVEACAGVEARGVVENIQQDLFVGRAGQEGMGRGIVLPEGAIIAGLPAFDGFGRGFVAGVGRQLMGEGPAANAGAVGLEVEAAQEFTGDGTVGGGRFGGEQFGDQGDDLGGPFGVMIAAGTAGRPGVGVTLRTGEQVSGAQLVEATQAEAQFERDGFRGQQAGAGLGKEMADQGWRNAVRELKFFIGPN